MASCTARLFRNITAKPAISAGENRIASTPGTSSPTLIEECVGSLTSVVSYKLALLKGLGHAILGNFVNSTGRARVFHLQNHRHITTENDFQLCK